MTRCKTVTITLDHAAPAEVARQIFRSDASEARHPALEAALVGTDVLDVIAADGPLSVTGNERHLGYAGLGQNAKIVRAFARCA